MSDNENQVAENQVDESTVAPSMSELEYLKQRANVMGISFSNRIGVDALKAKIQAKLDGEKDSTDADGNETAPAADGVVNPGSSEAPKPEEQPKTEGKAAPKNKRQVMVEDQMKLVRLRITNLDPKKANLPGEIITFANRTLGTVRKYVPFGSATDNGYHVPYCIYTILKERQFLSIKTSNGRNGTPKVETKMVPEFALEVLPQLTTEELAQLAASQAAGRNID